MHDKNGREVKKGDLCIVKFRVVGQVHAGDFCNCSLESVDPMPGNNLPTFLSSINTRQIEVIDE